MGRTSIVVEPITDPRLRLQSFNNRVNGIIKKALQLVIMCGCEVVLEFRDCDGELHKYKTTTGQSDEERAKDGEHTLVSTTLLNLPGGRGVNVADSSYRGTGTVPGEEVASDAIDSNRSSIPSNSRFASTANNATNNNGTNGNSLPAAISPSTYYTPRISKPTGKKRGRPLGSKDKRKDVTLQSGVNQQQAPSPAVIYYAFNPTNHQLSHAQQLSHYNNNTTNHSHLLHPLQHTQQPHPPFLPQSANQSMFMNLPNHAISVAGPFSNNNNNNVQYNNANQLSNFPNSEHFPQAVPMNNSNASNNNSNSNRSMSGNNTVNVNKRSHYNVILTPSSKRKKNDDRSSTTLAASNAHTNNTSDRLSRNANRNNKNKNSSNNNNSRSISPTSSFLAPNLNASASNSPPSIRATTSTASSDPRENQDNNNPSSLAISASSNSRLNNQNVDSSNYNSSNVMSLCTPSPDAAAVLSSTMSAIGDFPSDFSPDAPTPVETGTPMMPHVPTAAASVGIGHTPNNGAATSNNNNNNNNNNRAPRSTATTQQQTPHSSLRDKAPPALTITTPGGSSSALASDVSISSTTNHATESRERMTRTTHANSLSNTSGGNEGNRNANSTNNDDDSHSLSSSDLQQGDSHASQSRKLSIFIPTNETTFPGMHCLRVFNFFSVFFVFLLSCSHPSLNALAFGSSPLGSASHNITNMFGSNTPSAFSHHASTGSGLTPHFGAPSTPHFSLASAYGHAMVGTPHFSSSIPFTPSFLNVPGSNPFDIPSPRFGFGCGGGGGGGNPFSSVHSSSSSSLASSHPFASGSSGFSAATISTPQFNSHRSNPFPDFNHANGK
jgi:hypothetical protein